jgi:NAD(P)-dependent dehydrogenase (short-subunit alcohol dehydrogenase family)
MPNPRDAEPQPPFPEQEQEMPGRESEMDPVPDYGAETYRGFGRLEGRAALVTGADSGIGRAVALAFAREGADVLVSYLSEDDDAAETCRVVEEAGRKAVAVPGDLADAAHCRAVVDRAVEAFGRIDVLVNNAAFQMVHQGGIREIPDEEWDFTFRTNIYAMFHLCKAALPNMRPGSSIINTASIEAYQPKPILLAYATTKGAIVTFTKGLAQEVVEQGIRANAVAPGPVWTPLIPGSFPADSIPDFGTSTPMGRAAQPAELAPAYVFLASDESRFVNGEVLGVTGGKPLP